MRYNSVSSKATYLCKWRHDIVNLLNTIKGKNLITKVQLIPIISNYLKLLLYFLTKLDHIVKVDVASAFDPINVEPENNSN